MRLWETAWGRQTKVIDRQQNWLRTVSFSPDSRLLAFAGDDGRVVVWDLDEDAEHASLQGHTARIGQVAFSPDGQTLLSVGWDATVRLWNVAAGSEQAAYQWDIGRVLAVAVAPDGMTAAAGGDDGTVVVWDLDE